MRAGVKGLRLTVVGQENERSQNSGLQVLLREQKFADLVHHGAGVHCCVMKKRNFRVERGK